MGLTAPMTRGAYGPRTKDRYEQQVYGQQCFSGEHTTDWSGLSWKNDIKAEISRINRS